MSSKPSDAAPEAPERDPLEPRPEPPLSAQPRAAEPPRRRKRRRWVRVLLWTAAALLLVALVLRVAIPPLAPWILGLAGRAFGLELSLANLDLELHTGRATLNGLAVRARAPEGAPAAPPILSLEHFAADLDLGALLRGRLRAERVALDGLALRVVRRADGSFELADLLPRGDGEADDEPPEPPEDGPIDLSLPVEIAALRVHGIVLTYVDAAAGDPLELEVRASLRGDDLGARDGTGHLELLAAGGALFDGARLEASLASSADRFAAEVHAELAGLRTAAVAPLLAELGLRPRAEVLAGSFEVQIHAAPVDERARALRAELSVRNVRLTEDQSETVGLGEARVVVNELSARGARLERVEVQRGHLLASRAADSALGLAGLELAWPERLAAAPHAADAPTPPAAPASSSPGFELAGLELLTLSALTLDVHDAAVEPASELAVVLDELELARLAFSPAASDPPATLRARGRVPEIVGEAALEGTLQPFGPAPKLDLDLRVAGIASERLRPYLGPLGLESTLESGSFVAHVAGEVQRSKGAGVAGDFAVTGLHLTDGGQEHLAFDRLALDDFEISPSEGIRLRELAFEGTHLLVRRDVEHALHVAGIRFSAAPESSASTALDPQSERAPAPDPSALPPPPAEPSSMFGDFRARVERLRWTGASLRFLDDAAEPPIDFALTDFGLEIDRLAIGAREGEPTPPPATFRLHFGASGLAGEIALDGTLQGSAAIGLEADLALAGRGLRVDLLKGVLAELGIEPRLAAAELGLRLRGGVHLLGGGIDAELELCDLSLRDGAEELLGLDALTVRKLALRDGALNAEEVEIDRPRVAVSRDRTGALVLLGVRLLPALPARGPQQQTTATPALAALPSWLTQPFSIRNVAVGRFALTDASVSWTDELAAPPVVTALTARAEVRGFELGADRPTAFELGLQVADALEALEVSGELVAHPDHPSVRGRVELEGLRAGPLASYLPPGIAIGLEDGRFHASFEAGSSTVEAGGRGARLELADLELRDGLAGAPLFSLQRLALAVTRLDPAQGIYEVSEIAVQGLELDARRSADGFELLGVALHHSAAGAPPDPAPAAPKEAPVSFWRALRLDEAALPTVHLSSFDVGIRRLTFVDELRPSAAPFQLAVRLFTPGPQDLIRPELDGIPPFEVHLEGSALPLASEIAARFQARPFLYEPKIELEGRVGGIRGAGITELLPELASRLDGAELARGELSGRVSGELRWRRRGLADFDLSSGFGGDLHLECLALRQEPGGQVLCGLDELSVELQNALGASGDVRVRSIELAQPYARMARNPKGVHAFGLTFLTAATEPASDPGASPRGASAAPPAAESAAPAQQSGTQPPSPELRIDRFRVSGLDFEYLDATVDPPFRFPLTDLDLVVDGISTRALAENRPVTFGFELTGGLVEMPEHAGGAKLLGGLLQSATSVLGGGERALEERPVFEEVSGAGRFVLHPVPDGWVRSRVQGLELLAFRSPATTAGVEIGDGVLEWRGDARLERGTLAIDARTTLRQLSLSERAGGPISSFLVLPAPLDTVLFVLRNDEGAQVVNLSYEVDASAGVSTAGLKSAATGALAGVIADAIARSPQRIVGGVLDIAKVPGVDTATSLLGKIPGLHFFFGEDEAAAFAGRRFEVRFEPGVAAVRGYELERLGPLIEALAENDHLGVVLSHELGGGDRARAEVLANPTPEQCLGLAARLRQYKAELTKRRSELAGELEALYAGGRGASAGGLQSDLRLVDRELGEAENALDELYELLRPGAERRRERRTREAALSIAGQRLEALRDALVEQLGEGAARRIELRSPRYGKPDGLEGGRVRLTAVLLE